MPMVQNPAVTVEATLAKQVLAVFSDRCEFAFLCCRAPKEETYHHGNDWTPAKRNKMVPLL